MEPKISTLNGVRDNCTAQTLKAINDTKLVCISICIVDTLSKTNRHDFFNRFPLSKLFAYIKSKINR